MANQISEECKKHLRDFERQLLDVYNPDSNPLIVSMFYAGMFHVLDRPTGIDERCKEILRGIEPKIQSLKSRDLTPDEASIDDKRSIMGAWLSSIESSLK